MSSGLQSLSCESNMASWVAKAGHEVPDITAIPGYCLVGGRKGAQGSPLPMTGVWEYPCVSCSLDLASGPS